MAPVPAAHRIASLDALRVIAALAVVAFHFLWRQPTVDGAASIALPVAMAGYLGVNLFFLISGFVIAMSADGRTAQAFAAARFARIYPGFVAAMLITFAILALAGDPRFPVSLAQAAANLPILAQAFGHPFMDGVYWSIVIEIVFYFWVAIAIATGLYQRRWMELLATWLIVAMLNEFVLESSTLRLVLATEYAGLFCAGMLLHRLKRDGWSADAAILLVAAFLVSSNTMSVTRDWMVAHYGVGLGSGALVVANIGLHTVFVAALYVRVPSRRAPLLMTMGALTYPLYLLHQNIGAVLIDALSPSIGRTLAPAFALAAVLALSYGVWRLVERPLGAPLRGLALATFGALAGFDRKRKGALSDAPPAV